MNKPSIFTAAPITALTTLTAALLLGLPEARAQSEPPAGNTLLLGLGAGFGAKYSGAKKIEGGVMPAVDYSMSNGFFASTMRGIGWGGQSGPLGYSGALGVRGGRDEKDKKGIAGGGAKELLGMGEIKAIATANFNVSYSLMDALELSAGIELPLSKSRGMKGGSLFRLGASAPVYSDAKNEISLGVSAEAGDKKYMQMFYGVSAQQAAATQFAQYTPKSGFHSIEASVSWKYQIDKKWGVMSSLGATRLLGDAAKSPIVQRKASPTGMVMLTYLY